MTGDVFLYQRQQKKVNPLLWFKMHCISVQNTDKLERLSVERIPPPGWTVYDLYPTDRPDLDPDLNKNLIDVFLSPTQLIHQVLS